MPTSSAVKDIHKETLQRLFLPEVLQKATVSTSRIGDQMRIWSKTSGIISDVTLTVKDIQSSET